MACLSPASVFGILADAPVFGILADDPDTESSPVLARGSGTGKSGGAWRSPEAVPEMGQDAVIETKTRAQLRAERFPKKSNRTAAVPAPSLIERSEPLSPAATAAASFQMGWGVGAANARLEAVGKPVNYSWEPEATGLRRSQELDTAKHDLNEMLSAIQMQDAEETGESFELTEELKKDLTKAFLLFDRCHAVPVTDAFGDAGPTDAADTTAAAFLSVFIDCQFFSRLLQVSQCMYHNDVS